MMGKLGVYLCQVNHRYGRNVFLPHSVGMIQAFCRSVPEIEEAYEFKGLSFIREDPARVAAAMEKPRVVGISCYIWNWEYNKRLAEAIRAQHPECLIVLGGPQVPMREADFFAHHPYADLLVHYEGELPFSEILLETLRLRPDYTRIPDLTLRMEGQRAHRTSPREGPVALSRLPSPYLTGVYDDLMRMPFSFHASQETHRGCPYACTFCDWGSAVLSKVRASDDRRLYEELDWFGRNRIELLYNCDANYGLLKRDHALTVRLAETKARYGYPKKFRAAYAKNSSRKVFDIACVLHRAEMSKGVTLSFQSLHDETLEHIKRANIAVTNFDRLMKLYRSEGIPTYTELILGLPGETYASFASGVDALISAGQHDSINVNPCVVLPNAEMADPEYRRRHGLRTVRVPVLLTHSTPSDDPVAEYSDMVVETRTMSTEDWRRAYLLSWAVQCFHGLSLTQCLSLFLFTEFRLPYSSFYVALMDFADRRPTGLIGGQLRRVKALLDSVLGGGGWGRVLRDYGPVVWPPEEASFLDLIREKDVLYREVAEALREILSTRGWHVEESLFTDLVAFQKNIVIDPYSSKRFSFRLDHDLHEYFRSAYLREPSDLRGDPVLLEIEADRAYGGDLETYAREVIWYGRKGGRFRHSTVRSMPHPACAAA